MDPTTFALSAQPLPERCNAGDEGVVAPIAAEAREPDDPLAERGRKPQGRLVVCFVRTPDCGSNFETARLAARITRRGRRILRILLLRVLRIRLLLILRIWLLLILRIRLLRVLRIRLLRVLRILLGVLWMRWILLVRRILTLRHLRGQR